ncbi:MAG: type 1 glutamine amidotransferase [bacterium]|nr:type 1 glutamine amidotransferase [bacterium]MDA1024499.1 type 1 glutamine amidotransferase [bacterium]
MKIVLVHFRPDRNVLQQERQGFLRNTGLADSQVESLNVFEQLPRFDDLKTASAAVIGGSGDFFISRGDIPKERAAVGNIIKEAKDKNYPMAGICYGAQLIADVLGGTLEYDASRAEIGTFAIEKTDAAKHCAIFSDMPERFDVQLGHKDHITKLPPEAVNLARSERSEVQAFTFPQSKLYGFTFHPELDKKGMIERLDYYNGVPELKAQYGLTDEAISHLLEKMWDSEHAKQPLERFLKEVVNNGQAYAA